VSTRAAIEEREDEWLAPWAMRARDSRGRAHPAPDDPHRTCFQRDRDRIVHARAFRRLGYKTQVFINDAGDMFRTRLTHTIEVAQLARTAARRLRCNEDLVECIALVHDLGHPPFGHRGEDMIDELMHDHGGFEHNRQALRIVEDLERRYPEFPGLNLTYEVRESIVKHSADGDPAKVPAAFRPDEGPLLEAALVDEVDSIAYDCHDVDDGIRAGILDPRELRAVALWREAWDTAGEIEPKLRVDRALRTLADRLLGDLIATTTHRLEEAGFADVAALRRHRGVPVAVSDSLAPAKAELESWLYEHLYRDWRVNRTFHRARRQLADLFAFYVAHPDALPPEHAGRAAAIGTGRAVADYLAGMTDRFAQEEHGRLSGST